MKKADPARLAQLGLDVSKVANIAVADPATAMAISVAIGEADEQIKAAEAKATAAEAARVAAEAAKTTAEGQRDAANATRVVAEQAARDNNTAKTTAEAAQRVAETARAFAETARTTAENAQRTAEGERDTARRERDAANGSRNSWRIGAVVVIILTIVGAGLYANSVKSAADVSKNDAANLRSQVQTLEREKTSLQGFLNQSEAREKSLATEKAGLETRLNEAKLMVSGLNNDVSALKIRAEGAEGREKTANAEVSRLTGELNEAKEQLAARQEAPLPSQASAGPVSSSGREPVGIRPGFTEAGEPVLLTVPAMVGPAMPSWPPQEGHMWAVRPVRVVVGTDQFGRPQLGSKPVWVQIQPGQIPQRRR